MVSLWINPALFDLTTSLDCDGHDRLHAGFLCEARPITTYVLFLSLSA